MKRLIYILAILLIITGCSTQKNTKATRGFHEMCTDYNVGFNAENAVLKMLDKETNKTKRGKMMYYFALYYDLKGMKQVASEYYGKITQMQTPMFFEYRLAEWGLKNE